MLFIYSLSFFIFLHCCHYYWIRSMHHVSIGSFAFSHLVEVRPCLMFKFSRNDFHFCSMRLYLFQIALEFRNYLLNLGINPFSMATYNCIYPMNFVGVSVTTNSFLFLFYLWPNVQCGPYESFVKISSIVLVNSGECNSSYTLPPCHLVAYYSNVLQTLWYVDEHEFYSGKLVTFFSFCYVSVHTEMSQHITTILLLVNFGIAQKYFFSSHSLVFSNSLFLFNCSFSDFFQESMFPSGAFYLL